MMRRSQNLSLLIIMASLGGCQPELQDTGSGIDEASDYNPDTAGRMDQIPASNTRVFGFALPWAAGQTHSVVQYPHAYRAQIWHAIDFDLRWEEEVRAMKPGVISALTDSHQDYDLQAQCQQLDCNQSTNFLIVQHADGTESSYLHLRQGSASGRGLKAGDTVCQGQVLGLVGLNGFTSGPHLHVSAQDAGSQSWSDMFSKPTHQIVFNELAGASVVQGQSYGSANETGAGCMSGNPPAPGKPTPCTGKADGRYCGAALSGYGGAGDDLVGCGGGAVTTATRCEHGCRDNACVPGPTSPCAGKTNGKYCGAALSGYGGSGSDLVTCSGGNVAGTGGCPHGCQMNPPGTDDVCKAAGSPCSGKANGKYCGSTLSGYGGSGSDLVTCNGGNVAGTSGCPHGCQTNPPGTDDVCKAAGSPCSGKANGKYCGSTLSGYGGSGNDLVTCGAGVVAGTTGCPRGCQVNPPGTDDVCK